MKAFAQQLKWQFLLLQKNNIMVISFAVTIIYGLILFLLNKSDSLDQVLVSLVLNDPSVIGYFFIALAIFIERKQQILSAIFVTPVKLHHFLITKTLSLSLIGLVCSLGLAFFVKGWSFEVLPYSIGTFGICLLSALLGLCMLTFSDEFLKFALLSAPVFLVFVNVPLAHYLGAIDLGWTIWLFPIQGGLELTAKSVEVTPPLPIAYFSLLLWVPVFYVAAYRLFQQKIIQQ